MELNCPKHPHFKGVRAPKGDCEICERLYILKLQIDEQTSKKHPKGHRFDNPESHS